MRSITDLDFSKNTNNVFFLKLFAYPAFCHLILNTNGLAKENPQSSELITDFYDEETFVLIVLKTRFNDLALNIEFMLPNLYKLGFCYIANNEDFNTVEAFTNESKVIQQNPFSNLAIKSISEKLQTETYIIELFKTLLKGELHPVMRFYLLYQIVELLINKIGLNKFSEKKDAFIQNVSQTNFVNYHDILDLLKDFTKLNLTENTRINFLFEQNTQLKISQYPNLVSSSLFPSQYTNLSELIYEHRNKLVHGYYNLQTSYTDIEEKLKKFNIEFEKLMVDVVTSYQEN